MKTKIKLIILLFLGLIIILCGIFVYKNSGKSYRNYKRQLNITNIRELNEIVIKLLI